MILDTKIQLGLVGICTILTGVVIHKSQKVKEEMAKLLMTTDVLVKTAGHIVDQLEAESAQVNETAQMIKDIHSSITGEE